jgi:hypothetical protein
MRSTLYESACFALLDSSRCVRLRRHEHTSLISLAGGVVVFHRRFIALYYGPIESGVHIRFSPYPDLLDAFTYGWAFSGLREVLCSAYVAEAFCEPGMQAGRTDSGRDAIVVGRQLGVVLLEHVQPLGGPLNGVVRPA